MVQRPRNAVGIGVLSVINKVDIMCILTMATVYWQAQAADVR